MVQIREAELKDAAMIAQISTDSLGYPCEAGLVAGRLAEMDRTKQRVFVAVEDDAVLGFVHAELYRLLYQEDLVNVLGLAVSADARHRGCGRKLMQAVEQWAAEMHCGAVRLNSAASREQAHHFYEALGYRNTKMQKRFMKTL